MRCSYAECAERPTPKRGYEGGIVSSAHIPVASLPSVQQIVSTSPLISLLTDNIPTSLEAVYGMSPLLDGFPLAGKDAFPLDQSTFTPWNDNNPLEPLDSPVCFVQTSSPYLPALWESFTDQSDRVSLRSTSSFQRYIWTDGC